ncbi:MAG: Hpt domain-containing protein [Kiritimatiellia bacterium]
MHNRISGEGVTSARREFAPADAVFAALIPGLADLANAYRVNTSEVEAEILELFVAQLRVVAAALAVAVAAQDVKGVCQGAHSLHGMGGTIGVPELSVVGVELGAAARREDFVRCTRLFVAIEFWMRQSGIGHAGGGEA